jgi:hypothetical protein
MELASSTRFSMNQAHFGDRMKVLHALVMMICASLFGGSVIAADDARLESPVAKAESQLAFPKGIVHKSPSCGCCGAWIEHMRSHGFELETNNVDNLQPIKEQAGIPFGMGSCHTAMIGGYFIEGHVPAKEVKRLLTEKPKAKGLTVPAMPIGSPGMESGDRVDPYDVLLVHEDGTTSVWAKYPNEASGS